MTNRMVTMSQKEITRLEIIQRVISKQLTQVAGAEQLCLTTRQVRNMTRRYQRDGAQGLLSKRRGKQSNNRLDEELVSKVVELLKTNYADFGPTLACEKLREVHQLTLSKENVRQLMIQLRLRKEKPRKVVRVHQQRERRKALGEFMQIDGSPHAWFEKRAAPCCLLVMIDDATGKLLQLRFEPTETTQGYFRLFKGYLKAYGRPLACYHDKHGIFQINAKEPKDSSRSTQFERALDELGIESISAHTPQAKGRVERANKTLQDRLVKELRLRNISDLDSANQFLPTFIETFNQKFAVLPRSNVDAHRPDLPDDFILGVILSEQHIRTVSKNLEISFDNQLYQIQTTTQKYSLRCAKLKVCVNTHNEIGLFYKGEMLTYTVHKKQKKVRKTASSKEINPLVDSIQKGRGAQNRPAPDHPWRNYARRCSDSVQTTSSKIA